MSEEIKQEEVQVTIRKPDVKAVAAEQAAKVDEVKASIQEPVAQLETARNEQLAVINGEKVKEIGTLTEKTSAEIAESRKPVDEKEVAVKAAEEALAKAKGELAEAAKAHDDRAFGLQQAFNAAAEDVRVKFASQEVGINNEFGQKISAETQKVDEAQAAAKAAIQAEKKALSDYRRYKFKDSLVRSFKAALARIGSGIVGASRAIKDVKVPESIAVVTPKEPPAPPAAPAAPATP